MHNIRPQMQLAINLLQKYIRHRQRNIKEMESIEPEMTCDLMFADNRIEQCKAEIEQLQKAITLLHDKHWDNHETIGLLMDCKNIINQSESTSIGKTYMNIKVIQINERINKLQTPQPK